MVLTKLAPTLYM